MNAKEAMVKTPPLWLRWNCECKECKQKNSGQKTLNPLDWPQSIELENIWFEDDLIKFKLQNDDHIGEFFGIFKDQLIYPKIIAKIFV